MDITGNINRTFKTPEQAMAAFAGSRVREYPGLGQALTFPQDLWTQMGDLGLLDPTTFTHTGAGSAWGGCRILARTAKTLVREGGNLGLALSWMIHHLTARYLLGDPLIPGGKGPGDLIREVKTGAATVSLAVSEPGAGGHPKALSTRAEQDGTDWVISGEKCYLTNGPIARAFVVIAVTGQTGQGKKEFSAFLVDRDHPGLTLLPAMDLPFFHPSPHGGIGLDNCRVGPDALLGKPGTAYSDLVLRFRQLEDGGMTGALTGAMAFLVQGLAQKFANRKDPDLCASLGRLAAMADAAGVLSDQVAARLDAGLADGTEGSGLFFRELVAGFVTAFEACDLGVEVPAPMEIVLRDLKAWTDLGKNLSRLCLRKLGLNLIPVKI